MNKLNTFICFTLFTFSSVSSGFAQSVTKPDLYLYFKDRENNMSKVTRDAGDHDTYDLFRYYKVEFIPGRTGTLSFQTLAGAKEIFYKDEAFVQSKVKFIAQVVKLPEMTYDTSNEDAFPFRKVFIVEPVTINKYSVRQVSTYIGSD